MASITGLNTREAHVDGGTSIVITGSGFKRATAVNFEDVYQQKYSAQSFTIDSDTQITAVTPSVPPDKRGSYWVLVMVGDKENSVPTKQDFRSDGNHLSSAGTSGGNYATVSDYGRSEILLTNSLSSLGPSDVGMIDWNSQAPRPLITEGKVPFSAIKSGMKFNSDEPEDESF